MENDYSSFGLKDKVAIVTGPSQGIGPAIAPRLAQAGPNLVLAGRPSNQEAIKAVAAEIEALGRRTLVVPTDVSDIKQIQAMITAAHEHFGRIDVLVNNASWTCTGPALETTEEDYDGTV